jgi:hypothetical protein
MYSAKLAQDFLSSNGIDSVILNKKDSVLPVGDIEVLVEHRSLIRAKHLLKDFDH